MMGLFIFTDRNILWSHLHSIFKSVWWIYHPVYTHAEVLVLDVVLKLLQILF